MKGTIVNTVAVLLGSGIGLLIKRGVPQHIEEAVMKILGLAVCIIGLNGVLGEMFTVDLTTGALVENGTMLLLLSLVIGTLCGELLHIDEGIHRFGRWIERKTGTQGVALAAGVVLVYQGAIALASGYLAPLISEGLLGSICMVGYAIVICIGLNLLFDTKLKTANLLPAMFLPVVGNLLSMLKTLW